MREVDPLDLVEAIRDGLVLLDTDLTIHFANRSFADTIATAPEYIIGQKLPQIADGQWNFPALRGALATIISGNTGTETFEVDDVFPSIGRRVMRLTARKVCRRDSCQPHITPLARILTVFANNADRVCSSSPAG